MRTCGSADFLGLKMTKPNYKPNTGPNSNPNANPNTKQTLILISVHNFHPNPFQNPQIRTSAHPHFTSSRFITIRYDTIRWTILTCAQKLTSSQLSLPHGTKQKRIMKKLKQNGEGHLKYRGPIGIYARDSFNCPTITAYYVIS